MTTASATTETPSSNVHVKPFAGEPVSSVTPQFPRYPEKYAEPSVTGPEVFGTEPLERNCRTTILCLTKFLDAAVDRVLLNHPESMPSKVFPDLHFLDSSIALLRNRFFLGAPQSTVILERLIHLGVRNVLIFGIAGSLSEGTDIGQVVVCDKAVRDEGTSHHYIAPSEFAYPTPELPERLAVFLRNCGHSVQVGGSWTTDAIFRETSLEVAQFGQRGILTVEMEAAALFSVAQYRRVRIGAVFVVSDLVHRKEWERGMDGTAMPRAIDALLPHLVEFAKLP